MAFPDFLAERFRFGQAGERRNCSISLCPDEKSIDDFIFCKIRKMLSFSLPIAYSVILF